MKKKEEKEGKGRWGKGRGGKGKVEKGSEGKGKEEEERKVDSSLNLLQISQVLRKYYNFPLVL